MSRGALHQSKEKLKLKNFFKAASNPALISSGPFRKTQSCRLQYQGCPSDASNPHWSIFDLMFYCSVFWTYSTCSIKAITSHSRFAQFSIKNIRVAAQSCRLQNQGRKWITFIPRPFEIWAWVLFIVCMNSLGPSFMMHCMSWAVDHLTVVNSTQHFSQREPRGLRAWCSQRSRQHNLVSELCNLSWHVECTFLQRPRILRSRGTSQNMACVSNVFDDSACEQRLWIWCVWSTSLKTTRVSNVFEHVACKQRSWKCNRVRILCIPSRSVRFIFLSLLQNSVDFLLLQDIPYLTCLDSASLREIHWNRNIWIQQHRIEILHDIESNGIQSRTTSFGVLGCTFARNQIEWHSFSDKASRCWIYQLCWNQSNVARTQKAVVRSIFIEPAHYGRDLGLLGCSKKQVLVGCSGPSGCLPHAV